jgi:hypothetical protein
MNHFSTPRPPASRYFPLVIQVMLTSGDLRAHDEMAFAALQSGITMRRMLLGLRLQPQTVFPAPRFTSRCPILTKELCLIYATEAAQGTIKWVPRPYELE